MRRYLLVYLSLISTLLLLSSLFLLTPVLLSQESDGSSPASSSSSAWLDLDGPWGGPAQSLAVNPAYPFDPLVFAGGGLDYGHASWGGRGVFRSSDGGLTWPNRAGPENGALFDVSFSPDWRRDGYALAAFWLGLWSTADRGDNWRQLSSLKTGGPIGLTAAAVGANVGGKRVLLAGGAYGGIWRSADSGGVWNYLGQVSSVSALAFQPTDLRVALAATANGIWRSDDAGLTWSSVTTATQVFDLAFRPGSNEVYATFADRVWRSADGGLTWQPFTDLTASYLNPLGVSADGAGLFTAAYGTLFRYEAGQSAFVTVTANLKTNFIVRLAPSPAYGQDRTLLLSTYDGVYISRNGGETFTLSHGFFPLYVYDLQAAPDYASGGDLYSGGAYGVWRRRADLWQPVNSGLIGGSASSINTIAISPDYAKDGTLFAGQSSGVSIGASLYRSSDRGESWQRLRGAAYIMKLAISPAFASDRSLFMLAEQRVFASHDAGETWLAAPQWSFTQTVQFMALSPNFASNQTIYAAGSNVYRSTDAGATWQIASSPPPITATDGLAWQVRKLAVAADDTLFLSISRYEMQPPFRRHDQLWTSRNRGDTWMQLSTAPDRPVADLIVSLRDGALYLSVFDDNPVEEPVIAADLYRSLDGGAIWQNLGAIPNGPSEARLLAPPGTVDTLLVGAQGVWQFTPSAAPTATPDPCQELLLNRSFEYDGLWRIPTTGYAAQRSREQHSHGYWSMRTGIVETADNRRSYSDFSQDVALLDLPTITLRLQRWPRAEASVQAAHSEEWRPILAATTLNEFEQALQASAADLHYAMVIAPSGGAIRFLYADLRNDQAWIDEEFDLSEYGGQTVRLQFGTFNNGGDSVAAQYFDNLSLQACRMLPPTPSPTATPQATVTPQATPTPARCTWLPVVVRSGGGTVPPVVR